jgi:hypothetical protein
MTAVRSRSIRYSLVKVHHVLLKLPSADPLQRPKKQRLVRGLPMRHRRYIVPSVVLVRSSRVDDAMAGVAA